MIIVDSSVWIDYFNGTETPETNKLDQLLGVEPINRAKELYQEYKKRKKEVSKDQETDNENREKR